jgi:asparagine synthase (glutamine-hydrolysing)
MCGIAGIVSTSGFDPQALISMTHTVKHRGPDGFGCVYFDLSAKDTGQAFHNRDGCPDFERPRLGLGARRLAILDLSELGNLPMQIDDGRIWITYNGEIYNYIELRAELESLGHSFRTQTDTEVILRGYKEWGTPCVNRFKGMWAFAIYDSRQRRLFCSRDRFGIKPFYYFSSGSLLLFGSEIKQILEYPGVPRAINESIAFPYLEQGLQDHTDETFFEGVRQLPGGHSLQMDFSKPAVSLKIEKYWELPLAPEYGAPETKSVERFASLLKNSVGQHLRSDVPVGSCLSGGLDSSSIVAIASGARNGSRLHSFSSCYQRKNLDEREFIREMVTSAKLSPHFVFPAGEGFWNDLNCVIWHQDEPVCGATVYAQWCVMRAARQARIPVLLDGQGGDEILCGYRKFYAFHLWHLLKKARPRFVPEAIAWFFGTGARNWNSSYARR